MEGLKKQRIADFLRISDGDGYGYGSGSGFGWGDGSGSCSVYGCGDGSGYYYGWGSVYGCGDGSGSGSGYGSVYGCGDGSGSGSGSGSGYDELRYIKNFCGSRVYMIDDVPTLIDRVSRDVAKGSILRDDMTTTPCFVVKGGGYFAHGATLRSAIEALREKQFEDMPEDERIAEFVAAHEHGKQYTCSDFYDWHHRLTGSCEMGRREFAKAHSIDIEHDSMTVDEFIDLTRNAYGGTVIKKLEKVWETTEVAP